MFDQKNFTLYLNQEQIRISTERLAKEINQDYEGKQLLIVPVLKGAVLFAADLVRKLTIDFDIDFVRLSSYGREKTSSGTVSLLKDIHADIQGKHVLIVEEIIDSGRTLRFLYDRLQASGPASVEIASLLDKTSKRVVDVPIKYVGQKIDDHFLIGYGLDLEEYCRNLPDIYYLKYPN